jgi:hypothetical protein
MKEIYSAIFSNNIRALQNILFKLTHLALITSLKAEDHFLNDSDKKSNKGYRNPDKEQQQGSAVKLFRIGMSIHSKNTEQHEQQQAKRNTNANSYHNIS